jgi:hypothetical protein
MEGTVQEDDYRTEVRFKDKNLLKNQSFFLLRFTESPDPRIADPGLGSGPKSGSRLNNRWHQSGKTDPWLVAGSDPDCVTTNRDRDTTYVGTGPDQLPLAKRWKEKRPILLER